MAKDIIARATNEEITITPKSGYSINRNRLKRTSDRTIMGIVMIQKSDGSNWTTLNEWITVADSTMRPSENVTYPMFSSGTLQYLGGIVIKTSGEIAIQIVTQATAGSIGGLIIL